MTEKWAGKVAVVTGASSGIGKAIFIDFARSGIHVIGLARRVGQVGEIIRELGGTKGRTFAYQCDVSDPNSVTETFKWIEEKFGTVNIIVNNAGIARKTNILDYDDEEAFQKLNQVIDTNIRGLVQCTREAYRLMTKTDDYGLIIQINSIVGHIVPFTGFPMNLYAPSKFAVTALTETIRHGLVIAGNHKVRITSISPGAVDSEMRIASGYVKSVDPPTAIDRPMLAPEDVSEAVLFILSTPYSVNVAEVTIKPVGEKI